ncbi:geranylgeranyl transferase type I beta subunit [Purpureocillium lilacinum]|uniref:Geranylgeranyl transferase type I beta subunit n=1 Tax=Purpureocillium lilacinum TaxID=33203 RepID=A0A179EXX8_PURLI|nr:geranylgeranyl transferase type I beta subunit [Purpureocillium lilacinum]OAQ57769.1 geranylgeranyl transferase type I beta subunit [Purpureocillium lilacinum]
MAGLDAARHIKYWQRCHSSFLPSAYTANDSTRLTFAFFIVSALDLLGPSADAATAPLLSAADRAAVRAWVLGLQHPDGGFCGSPTHALRDQPARGAANLAATFFALLLLALAAGDEGEAGAAFAGVERRKLLRWLRRLQRCDGSFGQVLWEGEAVGGRDMRHSYFASCIRWMLLGDGGDAEEDDVDVESMVAHIRRCQTFDGGLAEASEHESHAGYAYCGIAALYMLDRRGPFSSASREAAMEAGIGCRDRLVRFFAHRQFEYLAKQEEDDDASDDENFVESKLGDMDLDDGCACVGFNGRWNKKADTCYTWWILDSLEVVNAAPSRRYLVDVTQHRIGGFGKAVGSPPDIYHSYLALAALALLGEPSLKEFDIGLWCSKDTARKVKLARRGLLEKEKNLFDGDGFWDTVEPLGR